jgi:hypothetical protein
MADSVVFGQYHQVYIGQNLKYGVAVVTALEHVAVNKLNEVVAVVLTLEEQSP